MIYTLVQICFFYNITLGSFKSNLPNVNGCIWYSYKRTCKIINSLSNIIRFLSVQLIISWQANESALQMQRGSKEVHSWIVYQCMYTLHYIAIH